MKTENIYFKPVEVELDSSTTDLHFAELLLDYKKSIFVINEENGRIFVNLPYYFTKNDDKKHKTSPKFEIFSTYAKLNQYNKRTKTFCTKKYLSIDHDYLTRIYTLSDKWHNLVMQLFCSKENKFNNVKLTKRQINSLIDFSFEIHGEIVDNDIRYGTTIILNGKIANKGHTNHFIENLCKCQLLEVPF